MTKHVIFDCFGTIIDTENSSLTAVAEILSNVGAGLDTEKFYFEWKTIKRQMAERDEFKNEKTLFTLSLSDMFKKYGIEKDAEEEVKPMIEAMCSERHAYSDVKTALRIISEKKIDYAIGSTTDTDHLLLCLEFNGLAFDNIYTSENMKVYKPHPKFYETILYRSGWKAEECLFVGDNYIDDVKGPKNAGMKAALLDRKGAYAIDALDPKPDFVLGSLLELSDIL